MAQAIARRMVKKMVNASSSKPLLFGKTFMSNSGLTFWRIPNIQQLTTTRKTITPFSPLTNKNQLFFFHPCATTITTRNFMSNSAGRIPYRNTIRSFSPLTNKINHHFLHPSATTTRRNYFSLFHREDHKHPLYSYHDEQKPPKFSPWLAIPFGMIMLLVTLDTLNIPYCRPDPVVNREDHVRYRFKVEPLVRQEHVQFKIVDNSVLELSYKNRYYPSRIVKKELPKGNYADAELRGWIKKTKTSNVFMVDITGFKRETPIKKQLSGAST